MRLVRAQFLQNIRVGVSEDYPRPKTTALKRTLAGSGLRCDVTQSFDFAVRMVLNWKRLYAPIVAESAEARKRGTRQ